MKRPWHSKTLWINLIIIVLALVGVPGLDDYVTLKPQSNTSEWVVVAIALVNGVMRIVTESKISVK